MLLSLNDVAVAALNIEDSPTITEVPISVEPPREAWPRTDESRILIPVACPASQNEPTTDAPRHKEAISTEFFHLVPSSERWVSSQIVKTDPTTETVTPIPARPASNSTALSPDQISIRGAVISVAASKTLPVTREYRLFAFAPNTKKHAPAHPASVAMREHTREGAPDARTMCGSNENSPSTLAAHVPKPKAAEAPTGQL
jgi:hypothetical protein